MTVPSNDPCANPAFTAARPTPMRPSNAPPQASPSQRDDFQRWLAKDDDGPVTDEDDATREGEPRAGEAAPSGPGLSMPVGVPARASSCDDTAAGSGGTHVGERCGAGAAAAALAVSAGTVSAPPQAGLYAQMALSHGRVELGRFELVGNPMVGSVTIDANAHGELTVVVGTSGPHAEVLDRYLPRLQRGLPEKVHTHLRIHERQPRQD